MLQLKSGGVYIDLYDLDPPKLNFTIEDIRDTNARSMYSRTFRVPATSNNFNFFETAFDINGLDFDVRTKRPADLLVNGVLFRSGQIRLNKVFDSREGARIDYEIIFLGETKDFGTSVGEKYLNQLDLSDYDHVLNITNVKDSWQAYPEGSTTDGLFNGDVLYPLIDFGSNYNEDGEATQTLIQQDNTAGVETFTSNSHPLPINRFKPMIRAKSVIDAIFSGAGYTYTSNFFDSNRFLHIYLSAFGNTNSTITETSSNTAKVRYTNTNPDSPIPFNIIDYDYGNNYSSPYYTAALTGTYQISYQVNGVISPGQFASATITANLKRNTTTIDTDTDTCPPSAGGLPCDFTLNGNITLSLTAGDTISVELVEGGVVEQIVLSESMLRIDTAPGEISIAAELDNNYKQIDFIKDILTKFRLVMVPHPTIDRHFIIEPWQEYIATGDILEWTDKLDVSKDFIIEPLFYTQSSRIKFEDKSGEDYLNRINQEEFLETFGTLIVNGDNDFLQGERNIKTNIIPTPVSQLERKNTSIGQTFIIPHIHLHEAGEVSAYNPQHLPIRANSRLLFYNGLYDTDSINWYIELDGTNPQTDYPMVSYYEDFPNTNNTLNLNWQKEPGYIEHDQNNFELGGSVYDEYWSRYIDSIYDGYARKVVAYFILDDTDLVNFTFNNVIHIKNAYYYVNKIVDAVIGKKTPVKVELIKIRDYKPRITPSRPRRIWNTTYQDWDDATFKWNL